MHSNITDIRRGLKQSEDEQEAEVAAITAGSPLVITTANLVSLTDGWKFGGKELYGMVDELQEDVQKLGDLTAYTVYPSCDPHLS